jgi:hypothetical protein
MTPIFRQPHDSAVQFAPILNHMENKSNNRQVIWNRHRHLSGFCCTSCCPDIHGTASHAPEKRLGVRQLAAALILLLDIVAKAQASLRTPRNPLFSEQLIQICVGILILFDRQVRIVKDCL